MGKFIKIKLEDVVPEKNVIEALSKYDTTTDIGFRDYLLCLLLFSMGLRISETRFLRIKDVDWQKAVLFKERNGIKVSIPIPTEVFRLLKRYKEMRMTFNEESEYLFTTKFGSALSATSISRKAKAIFGQGIPPRFAFVTHSLSMGMSMIEIKKALGYKPNIIEVDLQPSTEDLRKLLDKNIEFMKINKCLQK